MYYFPILYKRLFYLARTISILVYIRNVHFHESNDNFNILKNLSFQLFHQFPSDFPFSFSFKFFSLQYSIFIYVKWDTHTLIMNVKRK